MSIEQTNEKISIVDEPVVEQEKVEEPVSEEPVSEDSVKKQKIYKTKTRNQLIQWVNATVDSEKVKYNEEELKSIKKTELIDYVVENGY